MCEESTSFRVAIHVGNWYDSARILIWNASRECEQCIGIWWLPKSNIWFNSKRIPRWQEEKEIGCDKPVVFKPWSFGNLLNVCCGPRSLRSRYKINTNWSGCIEDIGDRERLFLAASWTPFVRTLSINNPIASSKDKKKNSEKRMISAVSSTVGCDQFLQRMITIIMVCQMTMLIEVNIRWTDCSSNQQ